MGGVNSEGGVSEASSCRDLFLECECVLTEGAEFQCSMSSCHVQMDYSQS